MFFILRIYEWIIRNIFKSTNFDGFVRITGIREHFITRRYLHFLHFSIYDFCDFAEYDGLAGVCVIHSAQNRLLATIGNQWILILIYSEKNAAFCHSFSQFEKVTVVGQKTGFHFLPCDSAKISPYNSARISTFQRFILSLETGKTFKFGNCFGRIKSFYQSWTETCGRGIFRSRLRSFAVAPPSSL